MAICAEVKLTHNDFCYASVSAASPIQGIAVLIIVSQPSASIPCVPFSLCLSMAAKMVNRCLYVVFIAGISSEEHQAGSEPGIS